MIGHQKKKLGVPDATFVIKVCRLKKPWSDLPQAELIFAR